MRRTAILILAIAATLTGCLTKEARHTLYLDPDGALTWVVLEEGVRSTADDPADVAEQEAGFLAGARAGEHPVALAFDYLDARRVETRLLREERPYAVLTEARFDSIVDPFRRWLAPLCRWSDVELLEQDGVSTLSVRCVPVEDDSELDNEALEALVPLIEEDEAYRILLTAGRFVDARGFEIDGSVAVIAGDDGEDDDRTDDDQDEIMTWSLSWTR
jgi:hypothetical protein